MDALFKRRCCLSYDELLQYKRHSIDDEKKHEIENHLLDCPLCADAVEGFQSDVVVKQTQPVLEQIKQELMEAELKPSSSKNSRIPPVWINRAVAMALLVLLSIIVYYYIGAAQQADLDIYMY